MTDFRIGVDAASLKRAGRLSGSFLSSYFHPDEARAASAIADPDLRAAFIASRFAVKEAYLKAVGTGLAGARLGEIETYSEDSGRPRVRLHGGTLARFLESFPSGSIEVSITHEDPLAIAVVLIRYERPPMEAPDGPF